MKRVEHLLWKTIGLDAASIGSKSIERSARQRMKALGLRRLEDYQQLLESSPAERSELVESVVVTETWFFRDAECVAAFARLMAGEWLSAHPAVPARLLCIPCATGEEPHSLVMALLDAGVAPERYELEAVDVSARALAHAEQGIYGRNSFRGGDLAFRDRYFQPVKEGYALDPAVRRCVRFRQDNILSEDFLPGHASYDFIFCRNLLIYFDRSMQRKAIARIESLLAPSGVLLVGPVEQSLILDHGFTKANIPLAFTRRKAASAVNQKGPDWSSKPASVPAKPPRKSHLQPQRHAGSGLMPSRPDKPPHPLPDGLETAQRLADAGRLREAAEICEAHLRERRPCAQAYYLLGLVRDAGGDDSAIDCYRRALYLEPDHYESLVQMALLLQKNGDAARARVFQSRAQRIARSPAHRHPAALAQSDATGRQHANAPATQLSSVGTKT